MTDRNLMIENIRQKCFKEFKINSELYHEIDINRVSDDNWQIEKFIIEHENEVKAYDALIESLKWKKAFGIHDRSDQYFPKEFFEWRDIEIFGEDKEGKVIAWESTRNSRIIPGFIELEKQFAAHVLEKSNLNASRNGFTLVSDTTGTGFSAINLEILKFKIDLHKYFPLGMRQVLVVDLPWILNILISKVLSLTSPKLRNCVKLIDRNQLKDYIDIDLIPERLDGKRVVKAFPDGLSTMDQLTHLGLTEKQINKFYNS